MMMAEMSISALSLFDRRSNNNKQHTETLCQRTKAPRDTVLCSAGANLVLNFGPENFDMTRAEWCCVCCSNINTQRNRGGHAIYRVHFGGRRKTMRMHFEAYRDAERTLRSESEERQEGDGVQDAAAVSRSKFRDDCKSVQTEGAPICKLGPHLGGGGGEWRMSFL